MLRCKQSMVIDASLVAALERLLFPEGGRGRACLASQLHQLASALELEEANEDTEPQGASGGSVCAPPGCSAAPGSGGGEGPAGCNAAGTLEHQPEQPAAQGLLPPCSAPATRSAADKPEGGVPNQQTPSTRPAVAECNCMCKCFCARLFVQVNKQLLVCLDAVCERKTPFLQAYEQRYVALEVYYLGWQYHGFASQTDTQATVEVLAPLVCSKTDR